jgi:hypothetical protein
MWIVIPIITFDSPGGNQELFIYQSYYLDFVIYVFLAISIITCFTNKLWFRNNWYINLLVFIFSTSVIISFHIMTDDSYINYHKLYKGDAVIENRRTYGIESRLLLKETFFINSKKDSVWTYYDVKGDLTRIVQYKQDSMILIP